MNCLKGGKLGLGDPVSETREYVSPVTLAIKLKLKGMCYFCNVVIFLYLHSIMGRVLLQPPSGGHLPFGLCYRSSGRGTLGMEESLCRIVILMAFYEVCKSIFT
jgi:hypothetical protein